MLGASPPNSFLLLCSHCCPISCSSSAQLQIKGAIVDKNARIGRFCKIINVDGVEVRRAMGLAY